MRACTTRQEDLSNVNSDFNRVLAQRDALQNECDGCKLLLNQALTAASNNLTRAKEAEQGLETTVKELQAATQALRTSRDETVQLRSQLQACEEASLTQRQARSELEKES